MDDDFQRQLMLQMALFHAERAAIPREFYSEETGRPFERCIDCGMELLLPQPGDELPPLDEFDEPAPVESGFYTVHKTIVRNEAVFEFAMCLRCNEKLQDEFSSETKVAIRRFCENAIVPRDAAELLTVADWLSQCVVCRKPRSECHRYAITSFAVESTVLLGTGPFLLCDDCEERMAELISETTRKRWDRFVEEHFDGPPGIEADWPAIPALV